MNSKDATIEAADRPETPQEQSPGIEQVPRDRRPRHIAIIMDGNGRWAVAQNQPRIVGHQTGATTVRTITEECSRLQINQLTLYCLSSENWKRPQDELDFLLHLLQQYLIEERSTLLDNNIRLNIIGRRDRIPAEVQAEMDRTIELTSSSTGLCLCLAINYGGRGEIVDAVRTIAREIVAGTLNPDQIDETLFADRLYTAGMSDPDMLIRTAGEMRISNYLLWQISYSELWVTEKCWPEFGIKDLHQAIADFAARDRRFGGLTDQGQQTSTAKGDQTC